MKEYIVASILAWLQTLYFLFKVRQGHEIKKTKQPLAYSTTDMEERDPLTLMVNKSPVVFIFIGEIDDLQKENRSMISKEKLEGL